MNDFVETVASDGNGMLMSGFAKSASTDVAWASLGVRTRRLRGRRERGSDEVGMDSGMGSDIVRSSTMQHEWLM